MKNNLSNVTSPYLLQHKNNPVHWQTWNKDILQLAKNEKKPILLSIGYTSCHWCHVMAHESFEDKSTADLMNKYFINIKVDREERPDIDFVFQSSFQLLNRTGGGWPLNMFLDENGVPFMGGTYFPKNKTHNTPTFKEVLKKVGEVYLNNRIEIIKQKSIIKQSLELKKSSVLNQDLESILDNVIKNLDTVHGGYVGSPKFPTFHVFETLLYFFNKSKKKKYLEPVKLLLDQLCTKGIYDHVEGGIARYSVDEKWIVPHFEKMLYDNAQFILLLSKYLKIFPNNYYKKKLLQTVEYINLNFLNTKNSLMGSSFDADSDGVEGKYYVFERNEIEKIPQIKDFFEIKDEGNWEGKNILIEKKLAPKDLIDHLKNLRKKKKKPFFDEKTQLDLNCLWLSGLLHVHDIFPDMNLLKKSEELYNNIDQFFLKRDLSHCNLKGQVFLEDYAYTINALLDLYDRTLNIKYKISAQELLDSALSKFYVRKKGIFQKNVILNNELFYEPIDISDHTISNGNSIMLTNFARLGYKKNECIELLNSLNGYLNIYKSHMISSVRAIDFFKSIQEGKNCGIDGCAK